MVCRNTRGEKGSPKTSVNGVTEFKSHVSGYVGPRHDHMALLPTTTHDKIMVERIVELIAKLVTEFIN